jgi:hypothetical protein
MTLLAKAPDFPVRPQKAPAYFSQEAFLVGEPASDGAAATLAFEVPESGSYEGTVYVARAANHGIVRLILDGKTPVEAFDAYAPARGPSGPIDLGTLDLTAGQHRLTVYVLGKNPKSTAHAFALDCLVLRRVE